jgi:hypothetical protein
MRLRGGRRANPRNGQGGRVADQPARVGTGAPQDGQRKIQCASRSQSQTVPLLVHGRGADRGARGYSADAATDNCRSAG